MKTSPRKKLIAVLALLVAGVLFYPYWISPAPRAWHQVTTSMTRQQVYALLGKPDSVAGDQSKATWKRTAWFVGREFEVTFRSDDAMTSHRESAAMWPFSLFLS